MTPTQRKIAAAQVIRRSTNRRATSVYRIDAKPRTAEALQTADLSGMRVEDRGGYGVAFRASGDEDAAQKAEQIMGRIRAVQRGRYTLSTGMGVHRREVPRLVLA